MDNIPVNLRVNPTSNLLVSAIWQTKWTMVPALALCHSLDPHPSSSCHPQEKMSEMNFAEQSRPPTLKFQLHVMVLCVIHHSKIYIFQSTYHTHTAPASLVIIKRLDIINNLLLLSRAALTQPVSLNPTWFSLLNWWMNVIIKMLGLDSLLILP